MAGRRSSKRNRRSAKTKTRRRMIGLGGGAGALVALGLGPLAVAPGAHADPLTDLIDLLIEPAIAASSGISPTEFFDPSGWDTVLTDLSGVGSSAIVVSDTGAVTSTADPLTTWVQGLEQDWITSPF